MATMKELVERYNEAAKSVDGLKPVKKFRDRETAERRVRSIETKARAAGPRKPGRPRSTEPINWPVKDERHKVRDNTLGAMFVEAMKGDGATLEQLSKIIEKNGETAQGNPETRARALMRILHTYNGFGIRQTADRYKVIGLR